MPEMSGLPEPQTALQTASGQSVSREKLPAVAFSIVAIHFGKLVRDSNFEQSTVVELAIWREK